MKKILKSHWKYIVIALILLGALYSYKNITKKEIQSQYEDFAKYLTEQGVKMYGTEWCSHCKNQKKLFGNSFQYINYTDCDKDRNECDIAGITGYPTWKINKQNYPGEQSLKRLAELSGYNRTI